MLALQPRSSHLDSVLSGIPQLLLSSAGSVKMHQLFPSVSAQISRTCGFFYALPGLPDSQTVPDKEVSGSSLESSFAFAIVRHSLVPSVVVLSVRFQDVCVFSTLIVSAW